jgi:hypothetical protein
VDWEENDFELGECPRCGHVEPVEVKAGSSPPDLSLSGDSLEGRIPLTKCIVCGLGGIPRSSIKGGYFKRDLLEVVDEPPWMGKPCFHCGSRIPRFLDLEGEDRGRIRRLVASGEEDEAVNLLVNLMGCPREWALIWITHPVGPRRPAHLWVGPPCPRCARPLRTRLARQCLECGLDWHDQDPLPRSR